MRINETTEITTPEPSASELEAWMFGDEHARATDGCTVEPDGTCPHGAPSWLIAMGII